MAQALLKFTQGANVGADGQALVGVLTTSVTVANAVNTGVASWQIDLVYADSASAVVPATPYAFNNSSNTPTASFVPDVNRSYRWVLKVWSVPNRAGLPDDTDIRVFTVKDNGRIIPPAQIWPAPLADSQTSLPGAKPNEMNFGGQLNGWAGTTNGDGLINDLLVRLSGLTVVNNTQTVNLNAVQTWVSLGSIPVPSTANQVSEYSVKVHGYQISAPSTRVEETPIIKVTLDVLGNVKVLSNPTPFTDSRIRLIYTNSTIGVEVKADSSQNWSWTLVVVNNVTGTPTETSLPTITNTLDMGPWVSRASVSDSPWPSVTYGNGIYVAVANAGTNRVATSADGITWSSQSAAVAQSWCSVCFGNGTFVAVANGGTSGFDHIMTSTNGTSWTGRSSTFITFNSVCFGNGVFVIVGDSLVKTSVDGINWVTRTSAAAINWVSVTYGDGLFVAVSNTGASGRVMTSPDGVNWTLRAGMPANSWDCVIYGNGVFLAITYTGSPQIIRSTDGVNWSNITPPFADWIAITYGDGIFVALASTGSSKAVIKSLDNGLTWTLMSTPTKPTTWNGLGYGNGKFIALGSNGSGYSYATSDRFFGLVKSASQKLPETTIGTGAAWVTLQTIPLVALNGTQTTISYAVHGRYTADSTTYSYETHKEAILVRYSNGVFTLAANAPSFFSARVQAVLSTTNIVIQAAQDATNNWLFRSEYDLSIED